MLERSFWKTFLQLIRLLPAGGVPKVAWFGLVTLAEGLIPIGVTLATGAVVGNVSQALKGGEGERSALILSLVVLSLLYVAQQGIGPVQNGIAASIGARVSMRLEEIVGRAILAPEGIAHLEDPEVADEIARARDMNLSWDPTTTGDVIEQLGLVISRVISGLGSGLIIATFRWWSFPLLIGAWVLTHKWTISNEYEEVRKREEFKTLERRADYYLKLGLEPPAAKEVRIFGLADFIVGRQRRNRLDFYQELWRARRVSRRQLVFAVSTIAIAHAPVVAALAAAVSAGELGPGKLVVYAGAILGTYVLSRGNLDTWALFHMASIMPHINGLADRVQVSSVIASGTSVAEPPSRDIRFERVGFTYPAGGEVFESLELTIPAGRSIALVGENGAGKTTLIKLLARLYDPQTGRIRVDGVDLKEIDLASWRRHLAVIFQDFVRYELSARDNVAFACLDSRDDQLALDRAAGSAGAAELIDRLPKGWDTLLSRRYRGGSDLSGGEWQKIALARALRAVECGASVLVLDEPTANLDVRAEAELFDRFLDVTSGLTTILISHRMSTVRRADLICMIENGKVTERGTHEELLDLAGRYARMFQLQAERFSGNVDG